MVLIDHTISILRKISMTLAWLRWSKTGPKGPSRRLWPRLLPLLATLVMVVACQSAAPPPDDGPNGETGEIPERITLNGAGATFPYLLYERWFQEYNQIHPQIQINYQPTGSAVGIQQMIAGTTDFGASDVAMTDEEMASIDGGVVLLPMTAGSVAVAYNLPEIDSGLRLSRAVLADIFLGKIGSWNDGAIATLNPDLNLPDLPVVVAHRSDGSGTTAAFTAHLSAVNPEWAETVGTGLSVVWPAGIGIKSNAGVSAQILQEVGSIGYVEYSYAKTLEMTMAALENQAGNYIVPTVETAAASLAEVVFPEDLRVTVPDPTPAEGYPIVTYSWLLAYASYDDPAQGEALREVVRWALTEGQVYSEDLGYVPLEGSVVERTLAAVDTIGS